MKKFYTKPEIMFFAMPGWIILTLLPLFAIWYELATTDYCMLLISDKKEFFYAILLDLMMLSFFVGMIVITFKGGMLEKYFAVIYISGDTVIWKCIFRKTRRLPLAECRIGVQMEDSFQGEAYPHLYFTNAPYPEKYFNKINKMKCSDTFIKFWYREEIADYLIDILPVDQAHTVKAFRNGYKAGIYGGVKKKRKRVK